LARESIGFEKAFYNINIHFVVSSSIMASSSTKSVRKLLQNSTILKRGAEYARQEIFGHVPILEGAPSGTKTAKKAFTGPYLEKYYPVSINTYARKVRTSEEQTNRFVL
jgi:hypothetical protein